MNSATASAGLGRGLSPPHPHPPSGLRTKRVTILSNEVGKRTARAYAREAWRRSQDPRRWRHERVDRFLAWLACTFQFPKVSRLARAIELVLILTILVNTVNLILATYPVGLCQPTACPDALCAPPQCPEVICPPTERSSILYVNAAIVAVFTLDYLARLVSVHAVEARVIHACDLAIDLEGNPIDMTAVMRSGAWRKTWDLFSSCMGLIDLFSVLPFYVNLLAIRPFLSVETSDPAMKEVLHLSRALRLLKLLRHSNQTALFSRTLQASLPALRFFVVMSLILYLGVAGVIFFLERGEFRITDERPLGAFYRSGPSGELEISPFRNLLSAFYWVMINTSTLKETMPVYHPVSQVLSVPLCYASVVLLALPISIIGRFFQRQYDLLMATVEVPLSLRRQESVQARGGSVVVDDDDDGLVLKA